jgi:peptidoglycan/xylan/chitin deacetylase (PgdA/CDA1 family)
MFILAPLLASTFTAANAANVRRQTTSYSTTSSGAATPSGATPAPTTSSPSTVPFSLWSTNPTAVPLSAIIQSPVTEATVPLPTTYAAGAAQTLIPGAPNLPSFATLNPASYPALDKTPPTTSPEVQQWLAQVAASGITIPDISPTVAGGCASNPSLVGNATRCWWTCGQCIRTTDITTCPDKLTWGLSYDDGPSPDTPRLLSYLASQNLKSTFFLVGSRVISRPEMVQAEYMAGHQLSVHTWSHPYLTTLTNAEIVAELGWTAKAIKEITGVTPNTMRPPYGDIDDRVRAIALAMGFTPIIWTGVGTSNFDTDDWHIASGQVSASGVLASFTSILNMAPTLNTGFIVLAHDLYQQSVDLAVGYILPDAIASTNPKFNIMSIIECQHMDLANAYIETNNNSTNRPPNAVNATVNHVESVTATATSSVHNATGAASQLGVSMTGLIGGITFVVLSALF